MVTPAFSPRNLRLHPDEVGIRLAFNPRDGMVQFWRFHTDKGDVVKHDQSVVTNFADACIGLILFKFCAFAGAKIADSVKAAP